MSSQKKLNPETKINLSSNLNLSRAQMRRQILFWLGVLACLIIVLSIFSSILLPFVFGFVMAYFLNPVVGFLNRLGFSRTWAAFFILLVFVAILLALIFFVVPAIFSQLGLFIANVPYYVEAIKERLASSEILDWSKKYTGLSQELINENLNSFSQQGSNLISSILKSIWTSGKSLLNVLSIFIIAPVVAFYLMLDWNKMVNTVDNWIPRLHLQTVRSLFLEMNAAMAGFIRGQSLLSLLLGIYYIIALSLVGLNFAFLIGIFIAIVSFIPYIGTIMGFALSATMAFVQFWPNDWIYIVYVIIIFTIGQFTEGYILQPKLVGSSVGLHPVWLLFSLLAFSFLFGFTGMLIAVPVAAAIGVLVRFALHLYLSSSIYKEPVTKDNN